MLISGPGVINGEHAGVGGMVDIAPTILDLSGAATATKEVDLQTSAVHPDVYVTL